MTKSSLPSLESPSLKVPLSVHLAGILVGNHPGLWRRLGDFETRLLKDDLAAIAIDRPVYVCGLARSGSTLLLEMLASHPHVATHRYQDFPFLFTPYWWNTALSLNPLRRQPLRERAHGDGMLVSPASPEAMEEMLWLAFFPGLHGEHPPIIGAQTENPAFEAFYKDHIRKLLLSRKRSRYVAKGNYNVSRLSYLIRLFPDARFVVPVREPAAHIASLMRQHARFCAAGGDPRVARHMSLAGHFEFGPARAPLATGDGAARREVLAAWATGREVRGWALYWDMIYRHVLVQLESSAVAAATRILRFEALCAAPTQTLESLLAHCALPDNGHAASFAPRVKKPDYYEASFTPAELADIAAITGRTARLLDIA